MAPKTWKTSTPPAVVVSMLSVSDTSSMPRSSRFSAVVISFFNERSRRSSFHTTSTSPRRSTSSRTRANSGRSPLAPEAFSVWIFSQPARRSVSSCSSPMSAKGAKGS